MTSIVATVAWLTFLAAGLVVTWAERAHRTVRLRERLTSGLLLTTLVISFTAGMAQRSLWPFDSWRMFVGIAPAEFEGLAILGVDVDGREHRIDVRAWEPLSWEELTSWLTIGGFQSPVMDETAAYLLERANAARERAVVGRPVGRRERILGPLAAPTHFLHPKVWSNSAAVPSKPFVRIRFVQEKWNVELGREDPSLVERTLVYEFPREL